MPLAISDEIWYYQSISAKVRNMRARTYLQSYQEMASSSSSDEGCVSQLMKSYHHIMFNSTKTVKSSQPNLFPYVLGKCPEPFLLTTSKPRREFFMFKILTELYDISQKHF